jgi:RNA recognition motif-containing protein
MEIGIMAKKLFVGGLAWETSEQALREAFSEFGEVTEAKIITDRDTGRSRGFGFVTFDDGEDANRAIEKMNGTDLGGRTLTVNEAQERKPRGGGGGGGGGRW